MMPAEGEQSMSEETSINRQMSKQVKCVYYAVTLLGNVFENKIPSCHIRKWFYFIMGSKISKNTVICGCTEVLFPKGLHLADNVAVGWFVDLDNRDGIYVARDANIFSYLKFISGSNDVNQPQYISFSLPIYIGRHRWIRRQDTVLRSVTIGDGVVVKKSTSLYHCAWRGLLNA